METRNRIGTNTIIGILVILAGSLFLLKNFGFVPGEYLRYIFTWRTIPIVIGLVFYFSSENKTIGIILVLVGVLGWIPNIWPILLIAVGAYIIFKNKVKSPAKNADNLNSNNYEPNKVINDTSIFGGSKKNLQIDGFKGGNITAIFGGSELNLADSTLSDGINYLEVLFIFGGTNITIPNNWNVSLQTTSILGSMKDKRIIQQGQDFDKNKQLVITGIALFGGGEIKSFNSF